MVDPSTATTSRPRNPARPKRQVTFTVLLPVVRPPTTLVYAARSVLQQTVQGLELIILSDGAPTETVDEARKLAEHDRRVRVVAFPKGERNGEAHRAKVVAESSGTNLAQLGDDDLWFRNHLASLSTELEKVDFVTTAQVRVYRDGVLKGVSYGDLSDPACRKRMQEQRYNFFGPTECAYRREAYDRLPLGWAPGPEDVWSDLNMWRKFLALPDMRYRSRSVVTTLKFGAEYWQDLSAEAFASEFGEYAKAISNTRQAFWLRQKALSAVLNSLPLRKFPAILAKDPAAGIALLPHLPKSGTLKLLKKSGLI